jgi:hypothetical protein
MSMVESINNINATMQTVIRGQNALKTELHTSLEAVGERIDKLAEGLGVIQVRFEEFEEERPTGSMPPT